MKRSYRTVSGAIEGLRGEGYTLNFAILDERLAYEGKSTLLSPDDFEIDIIYRFEDVPGADDSCTLYGISSAKHHLKGVLVTGFGLLVGPHQREVVARLHLDAV